MAYHALRWLWLVVLALALSLPGRAEPPASVGIARFTGDPCDFTSAFSFGYDQVLACYRSVPFCPDPKNPATCDRDAQVAHLRAAIEGFSDLREIYDPVAHWRQKLDAAAKAHFKGDYDLFLAMADVQASFRDPHWSYQGPACFEQTVFAMLPIEFGSMVTRVDGAEQQIIYLRDPFSFFSDAYFAATGIDVTPFTGQRVVSINGEPTLQFFRHWAREGLRKDVDDGVNLMEIFEDEGYTLRTGSFNAFPESRSISVVLETRAGARTRVELPWAFIPFTEFGYPGPPPASSAEFQALCFQPAALPAAAAAKSLKPTRRAPGEPAAFDERLVQRRAWIGALAAQHPATSVAKPQPADFVEVPPDKQNVDITEILPLQDGARTVAYTEDTVAIQLRSDFIQDWDDEFAAGATYACDHADRLIVDLRDNGGGYVSRGQRMARYLNAMAPAVPNSVYGFRELATSPALNDLRRISESLVSLGFESCWMGYEAACRLKMPSGQALNDPSWYTHVAFEHRGNAVEALTPLITFGTIVPPEDRVIPCSGKFTGKNLILLLNGQNGSMGFFAPELLEGVGTLVVNGGFANEPMFAGSARGGPVFYTSQFQDDADYLTEVTGVPMKYRLPDLPRPVAFRIEAEAFYKSDLKHLYVDNPPYGDLQVPFWSASHATDGAAYRAVVSAVERHAQVDPFCGLPSRAKSCSSYDRCARRALDAAVLHGAVSAKTADRTFEDAEAACSSSDAN